MPQSLTYYLTLFIIKLKGLKKNFSEDPINVQKIRKEDIHTPKINQFGKTKVRSFKVLKSTITELEQHDASDKLILFIHGGAFISGPSKIHWDTMNEIHKQTNQTIWMCDYPKAPEHKITEISENIDQIYTKALEKFPSSKITLIGDSVGGTLISTLTQRLVQKAKDLPLKIILVSPVMDASLTNSEIDQLDKVDPMLSKVGVLSAKRLCAENGDLKNALISPNYGSFDNFPKTILYAAKHDITYPDQKIMEEKLIKAQVDTTIIEGERMPHIWPFLPVMKEAKTALSGIIREIKRA